MKIIQITPGSGDNYYCENCLRDISLVRALQQLGHEVLMIPLYLPLRMDQAELLPSTPVFYGGINVYLQQKLALFKKTPAWVDRLLNSPKLLAWAGRKAGLTSARDLGETTISMLRGREGHQAKELDKLTDWLSQADNRPDLICLSNALLAGLARQIKDRLDVPVVCMLQDEDGFLDGLPSPYSASAWQVLTEKACDIDGFLAVSRYYATLMQDRLAIPPDKVHVAYAGVELDESASRPTQPEPGTIGYLSQICADKGPDTLVEAFILLKQNAALHDIRLCIAGGMSAKDRPFIAQLKTRLSAKGLLADVEFLSEFDQDARRGFLQRLTVLSVPEKKPIAHGRYVLEALGAGVPVVEPALGVFPELLELTGGGVLYEGNTPQALAQALEPLLLDPGHARQLGKQGREGVRTHFDIKQTSQELLRLYGRIARIDADGRVSCL